MTIVEKAEVIERLARIIPELNEFKPTGWVDFRTKTPPDLRLGPFIRGWQLMPDRPEAAPLPEGEIEMQMAMGCEAAARWLRHVLQVMVGVPFEISPNHTSYWVVKGTIPEDKVCW